MSWMEKLHKTYENCKGREPEGSLPLMPICHTTQQAHIEIVLDGTGAFRRASVLDKSDSTTQIPCTEESGGRAGSMPTTHPLCDKLQYVAGDFLKFGGEVTSGFAADPEEPHRAYLKLLSAWATFAHGNPKLDAILHYVRQSRVLQDLVAFQVLTVDDRGKLLKSWTGDKDQAPLLFKVLPAGQSQQNAFARWRVEVVGDPASGTWQDKTLIEDWVSYYQNTQKELGFCMVSGSQTALALQHPAKLRHAGDKAKLISANDSTGYTFRGKFLDDRQAAGVGFEVTQKAHNALRWLVARQGYHNSDQVIVSWAVSGSPLPPMFASTLALFGEQADSLDSALPPAHAAQSFALRLNKAIAGYRAKLDPADDVIVMGLDSATPGRMAITYYRELKGTELLERIEAWHLKCAWPQNFGKDSKFVGAPAPRDIAEAAYGRRLDENLCKATVERLLPCIVDAAPIPRDLVESTRRRATNRVGLDNWEWEKCLGIACALFRGYFLDRSYQMALEQDRTSRDYLYGRLLALAEHIEARALHIAGEKRDTTAARLMQRFADRPYSTWKTIELSLRPYMTRLRSQRPGFLHTMEKQLDDVIANFADDGFTKNTALSGEFLLGYHCQRLALRPVEAAASEDDSLNPNG